MAKKAAKKKKATKKKSAKKATTKVDATASIAQLLKKLAASDDATEKRKIRIQLRKLGHVGGLRKKS